MNRKKGRNLFLFLCLAPATLLVLAFIMYPTFQVFRTALFNKTGFVAKERYVGLANFAKLIKDQTFISSIQNTILYVVLVTLITVVLAVAFAALLMRENFKFKSLFRVIFTFLIS